MSQFYNNAIFWVEVDKIKPNPFQPRKDFDETQLRALSESIKQYGVLQALVVTRKEFIKEDGGLGVEYELIAGERRLRASKLAGLREVPVLIKTGDESNLMKLELAIIENVQREDLNAVDRARAFQKLVDEFGFKHTQIAEKVGKSREYVTNSLRLLSLPPSVLDALSAGEISEGHARPLGMLNDRPEEQTTLLKEIMYKKLSVREAESIARRIATDKVRKRELIVEPEILELEKKLAESLGTRVQIEKKEKGGKIMIDFFSADDIRSILSVIESSSKKSPSEMINKFAEQIVTTLGNRDVKPNVEGVLTSGFMGAGQDSSVENSTESTVIDGAIVDDRSTSEIKEAEESEDIYSVKNFSL